MQPALNDSLTFLGVFVIGLGLNLTPCVYPMLSITVSIFGGQTNASRFHVFLRALVYVLGMAVVYSVLGVTTAFTGSIFGAALQSKWVLLGIAILFLALAASLFEIYVFQAPAWLVKLAHRKSTDLIGIFISGMFVGVFAAPCIGPLIIALLAYVGSKADPVYAFWIFFVMSLGLGLPYLVLGTFVGLIPKLPKSGVWLVWIKKLFGVVLLGLSGFYFLLALAPVYLKWIVPFSLLGGGIYLGFLEKSNHAPGFTQFKKTAGLIAILAGLMIPLLGPKEGVKWEPYSVESLARAKAEGRPVIIDFYADWCIPCHELDQFTYSDPEVIKSLEGFVRLKANLTEVDDEAVSQLVEEYEVLGVPTILFLNARGEEIQEARITGFISAKELLTLLSDLTAQKAA